MGQVMCLDCKQGIEPDGFDNQSARARLDVWCISTVGSMILILAEYKNFYRG